jgi:hypothetical protein
VEENCLKIPIVNREYYIIYLEDYLGLTFIHCDVKSKWTKTVKQELLQSFKDLTTSLNKEIYALHSPEDNKHKKFLEMFNFKYFNTVVGNDNNEYQIYVWR